jgi:hypothetical protein
MACAMASTKLLLGGAAAASAALGIRVARSLHSRWRMLPPADRQRISGLAEDAKDKALALRGESDRARAEADLRAANETLAAALVETAEADPEVGADELGELRDELRRELERLASADIKVSRSRRESPSPPG